MDTHQYETFMKRLDQLEAAVNKTPARVWAFQIPFKAGTSVAKVFKEKFRAGALMGYSALDAFKTGPSERAKILEELNDLEDKLEEAAK